MSCTVLSGHGTSVVTLSEHPPRAPYFTPPSHFVPAQRRRRDFYDLDTSHWKLTGAARPADSLPGNGGTELINEREDWTPGVDLFKKLGGGGGGGGGGSEKDEEGGGEGGFFDGPEACREFLGEI